MEIVRQGESEKLRDRRSKSSREVKIQKKMEEQNESANEKKGQSRRERGSEKE